MKEIRVLDIDKFIEFVSKETGDNDLVTVIKDLANQYLENVVPTVKTGQVVWGIIEGGEVDKGQVTKVQFRKRYMFVVRYERRWWLGYTYSQNSIGKKVFLTEEDAKRAIEERNG